MCESSGHVQLSGVRPGQGERSPVAECRRAGANVNGDVEDLTVDGGHKLRLRARVLEMQTAHDPAPGSRQIILNERRETRRSRLVVAPKLGEGPSCVAKDLSLENSQLRKT